MIYESMELLTAETVRLTKEMRQAQKNYFKYRTLNYLNRSKELEARVDILLAQIDTRMEIYAAEQQGSLF